MIFDEELGNELKIQEIQRLGNIVTINLFRRAAEDLQLGGVTIRKGQTVTAQISMVMSDEKYFEEPNKVKKNTTLFMTQ